MRRREFILASAGAIGASTLGTTGVDRVRATTDDCAGGDRLAPIEYYSTASQVDANYGELTDESVVVVWAEPSATSDSGLYEDAPAPLTSEDGTVVGFGAPLVEDNDNVVFDYGQEEFVLNVWDAKLEGSGTVLWDEGHGQYHTLDKFSEFREYAEGNGYVVTPTTDLSADLSEADGVVIQSPGDGFSNAELADLADFVDDGGAVFLHDQSAYRNNDETDKLNEIAEYLDLAFRFNDDELTDDGSNYDGKNYAPVTENLNDRFDYFADREGLGFEYPKEYEATVTTVTDGDTFDVELADGREETIRTLGFDTPETGSTDQSPEDWPGIDDESALDEWGQAATDYATDELEGETVRIFFDEEEFVRGTYGRLLAYARYDRDGDGERETDFNLHMIEEGYARVYDSGFARHSEFTDAYWTARENGVGLWAESDVDATGEIRNRDVGELFVPQPSSVRTTDGAIESGRAPVYAESTAEQDVGDDGVAYDDVPLVGVDEDARVAIVGGLLVDDAYEGETESDYENYPFFANLADYLADRPDDAVVIDGGHQQFSVDYNASKEGSAMYQRFLEGLDAIEYEAVNDLTEERLDRGHALIVTTPKYCFSTEEIDAVRAFRDDGGAVILVSSARHEDRYRAILDDLAADLGTDLRLNDDRVLDSSNNLGSDDEPTTSAFDESFPLFDAYEYGDDSGGDLAVSTDEATDVTDAAATLNGSVDDLGGADEVDAYFEWGPSGDLSNETAVQTISSTGSFGDEISGLDAGTEYEFRAIAETSDGETDAGSVGSFTTDSDDGGDSPPAIDRFDASTRTSGPWLRVDVTWTVSDDDGDLASVTSELLDGDAVVDSTSSSVSGSSASDEHELRTRDAADAVRLVATDEAGNETVDERSI